MKTNAWFLLATVGVFALSAAGYGCSSDDPTDGNDNDAGASSSSSGDNGGSSSGGSSSGSNTTPDGGGDECTAVTFGSSFTLLEDGPPGLLYLRGTVAGAGADATVDVSIFEDETTGDFDLSTMTQHQTASHTVLVETKEGGDKSYFQVSGTFTVNAVSLDEGTLDATLTQVRLDQVTLAQDATSTPVPGGGCLSLASATVQVSAPN